MPIYDFECEKCAYYTEIKQRMEESSVYECPHCGDLTLKKVFINPPAMFVRGDPHTIGQMADRNTSKMGKYELQDKQAQDGANNNKEEIKKGELHKKINAMTPAGKLKWIQNGD